MVLLQMPPNDFTGISQVLEFAWRNRKILELLADDPFDSERNREFAKYRDFYKSIEYVAGLVLHDIKGAEDEILALDVTLSEIAEEATRKQDLTNNRKLRYLYSDFVAQHDQLMKMVHFLSNKNEACAVTNNSRMDTDGPTSKVEKTASKDVLGENIYPSSGNHFYCPAYEVNYGDSLQFQHGLGTKEHQQKKRKNDLNVGKTVGLLISKSQMTETKATQTEITDTETEMAVDQGTVENKNCNIANELIQGIMNAVFKSNESLGKDTKTPLKLTEAGRDELLQNLSQVGTSRLISLEAIRNTNSPSVNSVASKDIQHGDRYARQTEETVNGSESYALVKSSAVFRSDFENVRRGPSLRAASELRTLEDSLNVFGLFPRLQQLEKSLEEVRRRRKTATEHEAECKRFDKELQKLSREYHPDSVMKRGGSSGEVERAKELQTALNATRTVLNTINKIFLEDIDIDHKYGFFTKLDIGSLGNEDEVENHVYEVLFKISLVSEIKQENIIAEIRRFLTAGQCCIRSFLQSDDANFAKHRDAAFFHLRRCLTGYEKLHAEITEVEEECRSEKLHNIYSLINRMRRDCSNQLKHLEAILELTKCPPGELFPIYESSETMDDYFVLPFVFYINVIMTCSVMIRKVGGKNTLGAWFGDFQISSITSFFEKSHSSNVQVRKDDNISHLHYLAARYSASNNNIKQSKRSEKEQLRRGYISKEYIKEEFLVRLNEVQNYLESRFKIDDYVEKGTKKHILKELKVCKKMMEEFQENKSEVVSCFEEIKKNNDYMKERLDKLLMNSREVSSQLKDCLSDTKMFKDKIQEYTRGRKNGSDLNEEGFFPS